MIGCIPAAQASIPTHLVCNRALTFSEGGLPSLRWTEYIQSLLVVPYVLRVEEHECMIFGFESTQSCALSPLSRDFRNTCKRIARKNSNTIRFTRTNPTASLCTSKRDTSLRASNFSTSTWTFPLLRCCRVISTQRRARSRSSTVPITSILPPSSLGSISYYQKMSFG